MGDATTPQPVDKPASPAQAKPPTPVLSQPPPLAEASPAPGRPAVGFLHRFFLLRKEGAAWEALVFGILCIALVLGLWWFVTRGVREERILSYLPSPAETFRYFPTLWSDQALTRNTYVSVRRVALGFALATAVGVPLGVLAGCFSWFGAFLSPLCIFGRNIPVAALIPLTFVLFGMDDYQKVMFIFIACVAFIISDSARAVMDVDRRYIDTAYTLGAKRRQVILKVLVPLALPDIFNSLRLLFGLAFGYIMLAELVKSGGEYGGLGHIINISQRFGQYEPILLVLMIIPLVALGIDRILFWIQRELFPYRYGGTGILNSTVRGALAAWESLKGLVFKPTEAPAMPRPKAGGTKP